MHYVTQCRYFYEVASIITPILKLRKLRPSEFGFLLSQDFNPCLPRTFYHDAALLCSWWFLVSLGEYCNAGYIR